MPAMNFLNTSNRETIPCAIIINNTNEYTLSLQDSIFNATNEYTILKIHEKNPNYSDDEMNLHIFTIINNIHENLTKQFYINSVIGDLIFEKYFNNYERFEKNISNLLNYYNKINSDKSKYLIKILGIVRGIFCNGVSHLDLDIFINFYKNNSCNVKNYSNDINILFAYKQTIMYSIDDANINDGLVMYIVHYTSFVLINMLEEWEHTDNFDNNFGIKFNEYFKLENYIDRLY